MSTKMSGHRCDIRALDGTSKYGNPRRQYQAVCSCGWESNWNTARKWAARADITEHLEAVGQREAP